MPFDIATLPDTVQKAALEAFGTLADKLVELTSNTKKDADEGPKSFFVDPDMMADGFGVGYREAPAQMDQHFLRAAADRVPIVQSIIQLRKNQVASFCKIQRNKYSIGLKVRLRSEPYNPRRLSKSELERAQFIERFLLDTGRDRNIERDSLAAWAKKVTRDRLAIDQVCYEKRRTRGNDLHSFYAVDGATIRIVDPERKGGKRPHGAPQPPHIHDQRTRYVQVIRAVKEKVYTSDEMAFLVANPRTDLASFGYGLSEVEMLIQVITWIIWGTEYNAKGFSQGTTAKGIFNAKGRLNRQQLDILQRNWFNQIGGINNAWRTPVLNADDIQWIPLQMSNKEMEYQLWLEFLVKLACGVFLCDGAEIQFDLRGGMQQQPVFVGNNEAQQKMSKDRGLAPLLDFHTDGLNKHIVQEIDDRYEAAFVGLDAKSEEQAIELRSKQVQTTHTLNEARALDDLPPVKNGDVVLNPVYVTYITGQQQMQMAQQAQTQAANQPPEPQVDENGQEVDPGPQSQEDEFEPPGPEERAGAQRLQETAAKPAATKPIDPSDEPGLFQNDWDSSVHESLKGGDLKKSVPKKGRSFVVVDLD